MSPTLIVARTELRRRITDKSLFLQGVVGPVMMAVIIGFAFAGGSSFHTTIGVVNESGGTISSAAARALTGTKSTAVRFVALAPGAERRAIASDKVEATLRFPKGFDDAVTGSDPSRPIPPLAVGTDADNSVSGQIAESVAKEIASRVDAARLALASLHAADTPPTAASANAAQRLSSPISINPGSAGKQVDAVAYFAPAMAMLFLYFTMGSASRSLLEQRKLGTLQRIRVTPIRSSEILAGVTISVLVIGVASLSVVWAITSMVFGARWGDPTAVLAVIISASLAIAGLTSMFSGLARTDQQAEGITALAGFALALLGGSFTGPGAMPPAIVTLSRFTPNGQALLAFSRISTGSGIGEVMPSILILCAIAAVSGVIGLGLMSRLLR
ncbi:MAG: ABC transporter permease [Microthrixaceae bacterium]